MDIAKKLEEFFSQFTQQAYKKGEILVRAGENPTGIFYLTHGAVKQYVLSHKGTEVVVFIFKPISYFPMSWAMNGSAGSPQGRNRYFFEAVEDSVIRKAPADEVVKFLKQNPDILYDLLKRVYSGTDGLLLRMSYLMSGNAYVQLIAELLIHMKRFGKKASDGSLSLKITEGDLAAHSGLTRETVSREMKKLKEKKLVSFSKNILTIHTIDLLSREAETAF